MDSIFCDNYENLYDKTLDTETTFDTAYNNMNYYFLCSLIYTFGFTVSAWFISRCLWSDVIKIDDVLEEEEEEVYEDKYPLRKDLSGNNPTNTTIIENTPDGSVIISYNYDKEGFEYWADSNIKYDYLETAARKFANMNFCSELYIDRKENIKKQNENLDRIEEEKKSLPKEVDKEFEKMEEEDSVFIKSKFKKKQKVEVIDRTKIAATKANKYIRIGKCSEFKWLKKPEKIDKNKKISFNDFKNNFC